jgi:hypothetical protein
MAKVVKKTGEFIYCSIIALPSGKIKVNYTTNPIVAEKLGGVLTCRSTSAHDPISSTMPCPSPPFPSS